MSLPSSSLTAKGIQQTLAQGWQQANTVTASNTLGGNWTTSASNQPYYTFPTPASPPTEALPHEEVVPVVGKESKGGIFLRDEAGNLVHVETSKLFKAFGLEW